MRTQTRNILGFLALLLIAMIAATGLLPALIPAAWRPDLFVLALIPVALRAEPRWFLAAGFATGLAKDATSGERIGPMMLLFLVSVPALGRLRRVLGADSPITHAAFGVLGVWLTEGLAAVVRMYQQQSWLDAASARNLLGSSLITGLLAPAWVFAVEGFLRWRARRRGLGTGN